MKSQGIVTGMHGKKKASLGTVSAGLLTNKSWRPISRML